MLFQPIVNVVLLAPEIPQNTGNVIRLCANVGARLHLVEPLGFHLDNPKLRRAALDYQDIAEVISHPSLGTFLQSVPIERVFGATTDGNVPYDRCKYLPGDTIIFGSESSGLPQDVVSSLCYENRIRIPMKPSNRSINLSNAVAVIVYEMWRQMGFVGRSSTTLPGQTYFS